MEFSDDIEEESPCFIVPNSQSESEETAQRCNLNIESSLKDLAMLRSPSLPGVGMSNNTSSDRQEHDQHSDRNTDSSVSTNSNEREYKSQSSIPEKATESSSSESPCPNSTSTCTSSGTSCSDDSGLKVKMHALKNVRSNSFFSSTPDANFSTVVSSYNTVNTQVAHLTPLEGTTDTPPGEILAKDTSSSDCAEESTRSLHREIIATSSSEDAVSSSFEELKPPSSSDGEKHKPIQSTVLESNCSEKRPASECQNDTSLPKWQQDCLPDSSSVESVGDLVRTLSTNSTSNKSESSVNGESSSLHQWQSQRSSSDELFENYSETTNLQVSTSLQAPNQKSCFTLPLPELSQDIFHHRTKGLSDDPTAVHQESSPTDNDVIFPSQEDNAFTLYLTQSQASNAPSQIRSRPDAEHEKQLVAATSYESVDTPHAVPSQSILAQVSAKPRDKNQTDEQHWVRNLLHPETDKQELGERDEQHCIVILETPPLVETDDEPEFRERDEPPCIEILETPPLLVETEKEPELYEKDKHCIGGNLPQVETDDEPEFRERDEPPCIEILETPPLVVETEKEPELDEKDKHCIGGNLPQVETDEEPEFRERDEPPCIEILETPPLVVEAEKEPELDEKDKHCIGGNLPQVETDDDPEFDENHGKPEYIRVSSPDCKQATFTESAESSHVAFHFSPPNFLLRPMLTIAPSPCHETSFESQTESFNESSHEEIETTSEFESVLPEVPATTLSLSAPVPYDENSEDDVNSDVAFNLQKKDFVSDGERRTEVIAKPARSIFTNIRERFQTSAVREFDEERDPFEFRDEIHNLPLGKRRRIDEGKDLALHEDLGRNNEERPGTKRRLKDDRDLEGCLGKRRKGNKPRAVIDVDDPESDKDMSKSKAGIWKVLKLRTITTTSTMVEREIVAIYSNSDGEVLKRVTTHEFDEPTYATKARDSEEPGVRVEDLPHETSPRTNKENLVIHPKKNTMSGQRSGAETKTQRTNKRSVSAGRQRALRKSSEDHVTSEVETIQGSRVLAKWFDKCYYPGSLVSKNGTDSKYRVVFDDGDSRFIGRQDILVVDYLPRDQPVMFHQEHEDYYDNGVIRGFYQTRNEKGYKVVQEDGNVHKCPRSRVILDVEQAAIFLSLESSTSSKSGYGRTSRASPISSSNSSRVMTSSEHTDAVRSSPRKSSAQRPNVSTTSPEKATSTSRTSPKKGTSKSRTSLEKGTSKSRTSPQKTTSKSRTSLGKATSKSRTSLEKATSKSRTSLEKTTSISRTSLEKATKKSRMSPEEASKKSRTSQDKATSSSRKSHEKVTKQNDDVEAFGISRKQYIDGDGKDFAKKPSPRKPEKKPQSLSSSETPKSSHKSTAKEVKNQGGNKDTGVHAGTRTGRVRQRLCIALNKAESIPTRTSPRKLATRKDSQVNDENLILPINKDLFRGFGFVITGSDVNHVSEGDENSPKEEEHTTFNRRQVIRQIEVGGGVILDNFNENSSSEVSYILISNSCQTTVKYFYALVAGVPCLCHVWVRDCCADNKLIGYMNHLLPAGRDLITGGLVEKQKCIDDLRGKKVYLVADDDFKAKWEKVLSAAGCQLVIKLPTNVVKQLQYEDQDCKCDVIVVGSGHVSHSTILKARLLSIPTVTIHWLKQSILTGTCVAFNAHPSFTYRAVQAEK